MYMYVKLNIQIISVKTVSELFLVRILESLNELVSLKT